MTKKDAREDGDVCAEEERTRAPNTEEDGLALELKVVRPEEPVQLSGDPSGDEPCRLISTDAAASRNEREQGEKPAKVLRGDDLVEGDECERLRKDAQRKVSVKKRTDGSSGAELRREGCKADEESVCVRGKPCARGSTEVEVVKEQAEIVARVNARHVVKVRLANKLGAIDRIEEPAEREERPA